MSKRSLQIDFCSPLKLSRWLPNVCCPQLHILLFPQCKPTAINQLTVLIESLRVSVTLMAICLIWLAIKPKPTCYFIIYGGITNSFAIFVVRMLQKHFLCSLSGCSIIYRTAYWLCTLTILLHLSSSVLLPPYFQLCMSSCVLYTLVPSCSTEQSVHLNLEKNQENSLYGELLVL